MDGVHCAVENYVDSMAQLQATMDNFQKTFIAEVNRLVEYQSSCLPESLCAYSGPWYAPDDPALPKPWQGLIDGSSGSVYYWNTETNITQYEKPQPASFFPTDYHYHSPTHPIIPHPSYHIPPFATSAYPSESDYGYLSSSPYPLDQSFPCDPYSTRSHNSFYPPITYPHTEPKESIIPPYQLPYAADLIPPSALASTVGGTSCTAKNGVPPPKMKKSLHHNLKMRSHVMMKRKRRSQFPRRRRTQNRGGSELDLCQASSLVAVNCDSPVPSDKSLDSLSELTLFDLGVKNGSISASSKDAPVFFSGDKKRPFLSADAVYGQMLGPDELCQPRRTKDLLMLADFQRIMDNSGGPLVDWELKLIDMKLARFYFNLSFEKPIMNSGHIPAEDEQSAIVNHFHNLVVDADQFSQVTNVLPGLKPILLSTSLVESPVILDVSLPESYQHGIKHEAVEYDKLLACSFPFIKLLETLRVAHLHATLPHWEARETNALVCSKGNFEYDVHLENFIESLMRNSQKLFVNIHGKGMESKCSVNYNWLPSLNWNQVLLIGQEVNFQQGSLGNDIVLLNYNLCFSAEMHFLGLIASFVPTGLATSMLTFSHAWDLQIHKPWTRWITTVNTFTATLSHDLTTEGLMVVLSINSGTINLASLMISNGHFAMTVTSCHLIGRAYSYHDWLYFLMIKNQGIHMILIAQESPVQRISLFMFARASKNRVIAFVLDLCNQERSTGNKDKREALDDIGTKEVVMYAPLVVKNITELASLKHKKEALDDIGFGAFVFVSLVVLRHSHIAREVRLTDVLEFPRDSMIENALATFWLCCVTSMSSLKEGWAPHLNGLMALWVKTLIGECMIILLPQYMNIMKIFHQLDGTSWKLVVSMHVKVALQEVNIFYCFVQWAVSLVIIHFGYGLFPFLNECVAYSNADVANPTVIVCGAKNGHILPWKMATGNLDYFNFHDFLELDNEEVAHNALEWLSGLLRHDTHLYVGYLLDIPEIIVAWKNTKVGLVFYFNVSLSVLDEDLATIRNTLVSANSTTALRHAMWEVMLLFHGICYKAFPLSLFKLAPQQFYEAKLAKKVILDQATLLNVESAFFCSVEMESLCVTWFVGQVGTGADSRTSKWNCFSDKLRIHECRDILGGLHAGHEQYLIRSFVLDATTQTPLLVNPNDVVVKKGMLTLSSHKLLICALVMKENIVAVAAKYNTVRGYFAAIGGYLLQF